MKQPVLTTVDDDTIPPDEFTKPFKEIITTDLNNDGKMDTITLADAPIDPGIFKKIKISLQEGARHTFHAHSAWDTLDPYFLKNTPNAISSRLVYVYKDKEQFAIILFGYLYGSGREELNIIYGKGDQFKMIFNQPYDEGIQLHAGYLNRLEFVTRARSPEYYSAATLPDGKHGQIGNYSPFHVFNIREDTAVLDINATRDYNMQHYIWLGEDGSEEVKVLYFEDGIQPTIID